jgi:alkylresorcinol/alkylpyrone synthase
MRVLSVGRGFPPHFYDQEVLIEAFMSHYGSHRSNTERVEEIHRSVLVGSRYTALKIGEYQNLQGFGESNDHYIRVATDILEIAILEALEYAKLEAKEIDAIFLSTVTGLSTPSLDARLCNRIGFRSDVKRSPFFGLGCVAGAAGMARVNDFLVGWKGSTVLFVCVELCSLTIQKGDFSVANIISSGLFGDGAAAMVAVGENHPRARDCYKLGSSKYTGPQIIATKSQLLPDTERLLGWDMVDSGFKMVLSPKVPNLIRENIAESLDSFLAEQKPSLDRSNIQSWICHPGGPKILQAVEDALLLDKGELKTSWKSLQEVGNVSSVSVLFIMRDFIDQQIPEPGSYGVLVAVGPGFHLEWVLLRW